MGSGSEAARAAWWRRAARLGLLLAASSLLGGCSWLGGGGSEPPKDAPDLQLGAAREDSLHCAKKRCANWYRLVVDRNTKVEVVANSPADPALPDFEIKLYNRDLYLLEADSISLDRPRKVSRALEPGLYYLLVQQLEGNDELLSYTLSANRARKAPPKPKRRRQREIKDPAPPPPPPPPPPRASAIDSEVLEVERSGGEPTAVLLEAGISEGVVSGRRGRLIENGQVVGKIEIVDVYAHGSRGRIVGGLTSPITLDTRAEIDR